MVSALPMADPTPALFRLIYISSPVRPFASPALLAMLNTARTYNAAKAISGMLLYKAESFMQILEGSEHEVKLLFRRIERDPRHDGVAIIAQEPILERNFADWSMAFRDLNLPDAMRSAGYSELLNVPFHHIAFWKTPNRCQELLLTFRASIS